MKRGNKKLEQAIKFWLDSEKICIYRELILEDIVTFKEFYLGKP